MARTILCPKKCGDFLMAKKIKSTLLHILTRGFMLLFIPILMIVVPAFIPTFFPRLIALDLINVYFSLLIILLVLALKYSTKQKKNAKSLIQYVCPICKGSLLDLEAIKQAANISNKPLSKDHFTVSDNIDYMLKTLASSVSLTELKCGRCSKPMNSVQLLYSKIPSNIPHGGDAISILFEIGEVIGSFDRELIIEGCKRCNFFWFDKYELSKLDERYRVVVDRNL